MPPRLIAVAPDPAAVPEPVTLLCQVAPSGDPLASMWKKSSKKVTWGLGAPG